MWTSEERRETVGVRVCMYVCVKETERWREGGRGACGGGGGGRELCADTNSKLRPFPWLEDE